MTEADNPSCENCKFFQQHYIWFYDRFSKANCGYCLKRKITKKDYRRFPFLHGCELWESAEANQRKTEEDIIIILKKVTTHLEQLTLYFKSKGN